MAHVASAVHRADASGRFGRCTTLPGVCVQPEYAALLEANGLGTFAAIFAVAEAQRLDKTGLARWRERLRLILREPNGVERICYLKRYVDPPWRAQVRRILAGHPRESTAAHEWHAIHALADAGLPVPEPVAFGQEMSGWRERRSFLLIAEVAGRSLERWLPDCWQRAATGAVWRRQQDLIRRLASLVASFHRAGFVHRDLYTSHIFLQADGMEPTPRFAIIDLQRVFRPRWRRARWMVKDLAALHFSAETIVSRTDRQRFWNEYARCGAAAGRMGGFPARILAKSRRMRIRYEARTAGAAAQP